MSSPWSPRREVSPQTSRLLIERAHEELVAELGAAFLCADLGITPEIRDDHAAYLETWLKVLKEDKRAIFSAASHAQKAADYLHSLQEEQKAAA